ncbi:MAG: SRPBCC domain-containing protein [Alphaproteobacteria bacterium]|nr:SRPBCC domain-containing protein [Alphaproteobacteria bacterium]
MTSRDFVISRRFDAPPARLFAAFTEPARMQQWWGPKGFSVVKADMDLRVGGTYHYALRAPDGSTMWGKMVYREITPPNRIVWINSFSDEAGGTTRHPMAPTWPLEMLSTLTLEADGAGTVLTLTWSPHNPNAVERATFDAPMSHDSMTMGWTGTLDQLEGYLKPA